MGNLVTSGRFQDFWLAMQRFGHDLDLKDLRREVKCKPEGLVKWREKNLLKSCAGAPHHDVGTAQIFGTVCSGYDEVDREGKGDGNSVEISERFERAL